MTTAQQHAQQGDIVQVDGRMVGAPGRTGEILEVLGEPGHEHYRIRWEDGAETLLYPSGGTTFELRHAKQSKGGAPRRKRQPAA